MKFNTDRTNYKKREDSELISYAGSVVLIISLEMLHYSRQNPFKSLPIRFVQLSLNLYGIQHDSNYVI